MTEVTHHQVSDEEIRAALQLAVRRVWDERYDLVCEGASERTVVARIAFELEPLAQVWSPRWRADVEYNLWHHRSGIIKKALYVHDGKQRRKRSVYPDLILHDPRDEEGSNLLVLEAKRGRPAPGDRSYDLAKLDAYKTYLHYRHAVYMEFDGLGGDPRLEWLGHSEPVSEQLQLGEGDATGGLVPPARKPGEQSAPAGVRIRVILRVGPEPCPQNPMQVSSARIPEPVNVIKAGRSFYPCAGIVARPVGVGRAC